MPETSIRRVAAAVQRRTEAEAEVPLFLSLRMRRIAEYLLGVPSLEETLSWRHFSEQGGTNSAATTSMLAAHALGLPDAAAAAAAALIEHHGFAHSHVAHFMAAATGTVSHMPLGLAAAPDVYAATLERLGDALADDPPAGVDWGLAPKLPVKAIGLSVHSPQGAICTEKLLLRKRSQRRARSNAADALWLPPWFGDDTTASTSSRCARRASQMGTDALPVSRSRDQIVRLVRENQVLLLTAETGSGKTTQVPQFILEAAASDAAEGGLPPPRVVVTEPRRIAAVSVAHRVADERGEVVGGGTVGYKIRSETLAAPCCRLLFCTTGVLLRRLAQEGAERYFSPATVTHLIIDEVHERKAEVDFLLTFVRDARIRRPDLRVVLMSATMNTERLVQYFAEGSGASVPLLDLEGRVFPVREIYYEAIELGVLGESRRAKRKPARQEQIGETGLMQATIGGGFKAKYKRGWMKQFMKEVEKEEDEREGIDYGLMAQLIERVCTLPGGAWELVDKLEHNGDESSHAGGNGLYRDVGADGALLIFMPGVQEISELVSKLDERPGRDSWWVLPLHGSLPVEEQQLCFSKELPAGKLRKIVVATNVAETSVTIPDISVVVDSCRERRVDLNAQNNLPVLQERHCAQDSMTQRRGRAGRTRPGVCFRFISKEELEVLELTTPPEVQRMPLENLYLQVCASGVEDRPGFLASMPDPPAEESVERAEEVLDALDALDFSAKDGLSPLGRHLAILPCHPRLGKMLLLGCLLGCAGACLNIAGVLSVRSPMLSTVDNPQKSRWEHHRGRLLEQVGCRSDHCAWAWLLSAWQVASAGERWKLCDSYGLRWEDMAHASAGAKELAESLAFQGFLSDLELQGFLRDGAAAPPLASGGDLENQEAQDVPVAARSVNWTLVRSAVSGGFYPTILFAERQVSTGPRGQSRSWTRYWIQLLNQASQQVHLHPSGLCFGQEDFQCPYLAAFSVQQTKHLYAYEVTEVVPLALLLFGEEPTYNAKARQLVAGGWARFRCGGGRLLLPLISSARRVVSAVLAQKLEDPSLDHGGSPGLAAVRLLLGTGGLCFERAKSFTLPARGLQPAGQADNPVRRIAGAVAGLVHGLAMELADGSRRGALLDAYGRPLAVTGDGNWALRGGRWEELGPDEWIVRVEGVNAKPSVIGVGALCGALALITNLGRELLFVGTRVDWMQKAPAAAAAPTWRSGLDAMMKESGTGAGRALASFEFEAGKGQEIQEVVFKGDGACRCVVRAPRRAAPRTTVEEAATAASAELGPAGEGGAQVCAGYPARSGARGSARGRGGRGRGRVDHFAA